MWHWLAVRAGNSAWRAINEGGGITSLSSDPHLSDMSKGRQKDLTVDVNWELGNIPSLVGTGVRYRDRQSNRMPYRYMR